MDIDSSEEKVEHGVLAIIVTGTDAGDEAGFAINKCVDDDLVTDEAYCFGHEGGTKGVHEMTPQVDFKSGHVIWRYRPLLVLLMSSDRLAGVWPAHPLHLALPFAPFGVGPAASSQLLGLDGASCGFAGH